MSPEQQKKFQKQLKKIPRIDCKIALALFNAKKIILIDTHDDLKLGEPSPIPGALTLPYPKIKKVRVSLPKNARIVTFCH
jgi:hypothetical protein